MLYISHGYIVSLGCECGLPPCTICKQPRLRMNLSPVLQVLRKCLAALVVTVLIGDMDGY